jgi:hypothetical protein
MADEKRIPLYEIHTAAWLEFKGVELTLTKQGTRVVFEFDPSEEAYNLLRQYQTNPLTPILDYVNVLRRLRARMLSMRD